MKAIKILTAAVATVMALGTAQAQTTDLVLGARPQGLGGAYTAVADDANAVYWNPAGLGILEAREATFMHWMFSDVSQVMVDYAAYAQPLGGGAIGLSWTRQGAKLEQGPDAFESTMSVNSFLVSFGMPVADFVSLGVTFNRTIVTSIAPTNGEVAFDGGLLFKPLSDREWTLGVTAKNVGGEQVLPPWYAVGTAYKFVWDHQYLLLAVDGHTQDEIQGSDNLAIKYGGGFEFRQYIDDFSLALRGGINSRTFSGGFGLNWKTIFVDYAYVHMREDTIGDSHKFGVSYRFGN